MIWLNYNVYNIVIVFVLMSVAVLLLLLLLLLLVLLLLLLLLLLVLLLLLLSLLLASESLSPPLSFFLGPRHPYHHHYFALFRACRAFHIENITTATSWLSHDEFMQSVREGQRDLICAGAA